MNMKYLKLYEAYNNQKDKIVDKVNYLVVDFFIRKLFSYFELDRSEKNDTVLYCFKYEDEVVKSLNLDFRGSLVRKNGSISNKKLQPVLQLKKNKLLQMSHLMSNNLKSYIFDRTGYNNHKIYWHSVKSLISRIPEIAKKIDIDDFHLSISNID